MAAQDAAHAEIEAAADAVGADGFLDVTGATGSVAAAALHADHEFQGREDNAIGADEKYQKGLHEPPSMADFLKKAMREGSGSV
jgi:hypothetical protein